MRWQLAKFVKFREEKFGGVLFETRRERVFTLNPVGAAVVRAIVDGQGDLSAVLHEKFEDPEGTLEGEANEFVSSLAEAGLVAEAP